MVDRAVFADGVDRCVFYCYERNSKFWKSIPLKLFAIILKHYRSCFFQVVYFTSMFPYLVLTIFFIEGLTLEGAGAGLAHMLKPKVNFR